ncbi:unnamed protein product [Phytomonas sp. EM1]|nr:unnamed protein product [Phytomonas sp. EM1]|eukprot:CCW64207.1 unnamed protein product [Phytomonas sp. isolate EM1]
MMASLVNTYLRKSLQKVTSRCRELTVVLGNEAGDMDSVVGSICLAMFLDSQPEYGMTPVIPAINFPLDELPLRTDVYHLFHQIGLDISSLISVIPSTTTIDHAGNYLDLVDLLPNIVLYDHNQLSVSQSFLNNNVVGIVDHHFDNKLYVEQTNRLRVIETVGSACTLVAELYKEAGITVPYPILFLSTIILDTVNFDSQQQKTTLKDVKMFEWLSSMMPEKIDSHKVFEKLSEWRRDIFGLSLEQNFKRDYKFFSFEMGDKNSHLDTGISSIPCSYDKFKDKYTLEEIASSCYLFLIRNKLDALVVSFAGKKDETHTRDILFVVKVSEFQMFIDYANSFQKRLIFYPSDKIEIGKSHILIAFSLSDTSVSRKSLVPSLANFLKGKTQSTL